MWTCCVTLNDTCDLFGPYALICKIQMTGISLQHPVKTNYTKQPNTAPGTSQVLNKQRYCYYWKPYMLKSFPGASVGEESAGNAGDTGGEGLTPGSGRALGGGHGNPLQYSCLENPMDRAAWWTTVRGVTKSWT